MDDQMRSAVMLVAITAAFIATWLSSPAAAVVLR